MGKEDVISTYNLMCCWYARVCVCVCVLGVRRRQCQYQSLLWMRTSTQVILCEVQKLIFNACEKIRGSILESCIFFNFLSLTSVVKYASLSWLASEV